MVSFRSSFILLATAINVALSLPVEERSLSDVTADFQTLSLDTTALVNDLNSLPGSGVDGLNTLNTDSSKFIADLEKTTSDVESTGKLDEADAQAFVSQTVGPATESLISLLDLFVTQKPAVEQLAAQVPDVISETEETLEEFAGNGQALMNALDAIAPPDVVSAAGPLATSLTTAFETAIAAYSD